MTETISGKKLTEHTAADDKLNEALDAMRPAKDPEEKEEKPEPKKPMREKYAVIDYVDYGLENYGPANGHPVIGIHFKEVAAADTPKCFDEKGNEMPEYYLYADFIKHIKKAKLEKSYHNAINGKLETYLKFNDGWILGKEHYDEIEDFHTVISQESADLQKQQRVEGIQDFGQIRPPFFMWEGKPTTFTGAMGTGNSGKYELFNIPYAVLKVGESYNQMALAQIMQHTFGKLYIEWVEGQDNAGFIEQIRDTFNDYKSVIIFRENVKEEAVGFCMENGYVGYMIW